MRHISQGYVTQSRLTPQLATESCIFTWTSLEYISQIRDLIKTTYEKDSPVNDKFFDSVRFWQKAYEESQAEQTKLLDKIYELEQRNQSLLAKARENASNKNKSSESTKRKAAGLDGDRNDAEAVRKRPRGQPPNARPQAKPKSAWAESDPKEDEIERESLFDLPLRLC